MNKKTQLALNKIEDFMKTYNLSIEKIQEEVNRLGKEGFTVAYPFDGYNKNNFMYLFNTLKIESPISITCEICGKEFNSKSPIVALMKHKIYCKTKKDFLKKYNFDKEKLELALEEEGSIQNFLIKYPEMKYRAYRLFKEFGISTSIKRACNHSSSKEKRKKTLIEKTGFEHNFSKGSPSREKWEKRLLEEEGITNVFQREDVKRKAINTILTKYETELWRHSLTVRGKGVVSSINKMVFSILEEANIEFEIEFKVKNPNKHYYAYDIKIGNKIIEVNGDYWHGNPSIYKEDDLYLKGSSKEMYVKDKWGLDKKKIDFIKSMGYSVLIVWELDLKTKFEETKEKILNYARS